MEPELSDKQRTRIVFAGKIYAGIYSALGQFPCTTFLCAEDGYATRFHACVCTPGTITVTRVGVEGAEDEG